MAKRNKIRVYVHFVWRTWDSLPLITEEIERDLFRYMSTVCQDDKCDVLAIGGMPDHVHLFASLAPTISIAELMKHVKGGSSRFVSKHLCLGPTFQWQGHYGAFSVSPHEKSVVIQYVRNQKQHHAEGRIWKEAEDPTEEFVYQDAP